MDFEKICMMFTMQEPFYGILLSSMTRIPDATKTSTMAVGMSGNVFRLYYNPAFVESLDIDTTLEAIKHEVLHCAFNHFTIWEDKTTDPHEHYLRNVACDFEVNSYLNKDKAKGGSSWLWPEDKGFKKFLGSREYLRLVKQKEQQKKEEEQKAQEQQPQQPCNGGQGGQQSQQRQQSNQSGNQDNSDGQPNNEQNDDQDMPNFGQFAKSAVDKKVEKEIEEMYQRFDDHDKWPEDISEAEAEQVKQIVETMLDFAAQECEKSCGSIPGEMVGKIEQIRKKPKPVTDWKRHFRRYLGNEFTDVLKKSKKRESKRFPDAAGTRHRRKSRILIGIDTSGSVSMPEYNEFFGQIKTMIATTDFHVIECDARIQHEYDFRGKIPQELHGGGGTDFSPVIDYYLEHRKQYEALVYFTDGEATIPKNTPKDTLWVISSRGDKNRKKYTVNGASVVFIPKKK